MRTESFEHCRSHEKWFRTRETSLSPPPPVIDYLPFQGGTFVVVPLVYMFLCSCVYGL